MKKLVKLGAVAVASMALAGCEQPADTNGEEVTEQSGNADVGTIGDTAQPADAIDSGTVQDLDDVVPMLDPTIPPNADELRDAPKLPDDLPDRPSDTVRGAPQ